LQVFYGLLSDCVPILGYRRKPYLIMGWFTHIIWQVRCRQSSLPPVVKSFL
ncbi:unnamed protein product, partial [Phaeothamnion confervicola]